LAVSSGTAFFLEKIQAVTQMMELYFYEECEYSQIVLNTITNLKIKDQFTFKNIRENPDYATELTELTGNVTVPCLVTADGPMKEAREIRKYLVTNFM
jgi:glutaredoxin 2